METIVVGIAVLIIIAVVILGGYLVIDRVYTAWYYRDVRKANRR